MGCVRIQKSVFMAKTERKNYEIIATSLSKIQKAYNNMDSIMLVPVPEDDARAMRIIGHEVDVAMILNTTGTFWV